MLVLRNSLGVEDLWALIPWSCDPMSTWIIVTQIKQQVGEFWVCVILFACVGADAPINIVHDDTDYFGNFSKNM